jgi:hypothetical protein
MKEVSVTAWCDGCATEDGGTVEPATEEVTVTIGPGRPRLLDLCERHRKALVEPLALLLAESGQDPPQTRQASARTPGRPPGRTGQKPRHPDRFPCLWCDVMYGTMGALSSHYVRDHGLTDGKVETVYGTRCPECGETVNGGGPGFGVHVRTAHGATSVARLFANVGTSDPFGVVAARRKRRHRI